MLSQDKRFPSKAGATIAIHFVQPEPTTLVLLSTGLFGLAMMRRRKLSRSVSRLAPATIYKGRFPTGRAKTPEIQRPHGEGIGPTEIAKRLS